MNNIISQHGSRSIVDGRSSACGTARSAALVTRSVKLILNYISFMYILLIFNLYYLKLKHIKIN